jgi:hypothetical protein
VRRPQHRPLRDHGRAGANILTGAADVVAGQRRLEDADAPLGQTNLARHAASGFVRLFKGNDRIGTGWDRRAGHDPHRLSGADRPLEDISRRQFADHGELDRPLFARAIGARRLYGVAIHRRVIERWDIERRPNLLGRHLPERIQNRLLNRVQAREVGENPLARLLDADHGAHSVRGNRQSAVERRTHHCRLPTADCRPSSEPHGEAGGRPLDALDRLDAVGDAVAKAVEVVRFQLHDDVEGSGDGIDGDHPRVFVVEVLH